MQDEIYYTIDESGNFIQHYRTPGALNGFVNGVMKDFSKKAKGIRDAAGNYIYNKTSNGNYGNNASGKSVTGAIAKVRNSFGDAVGINKLQQTAKVKTNYTAKDNKITSKLGATAKNLQGHATNLANGLKDSIHNKLAKNYNDVSVGTRKLARNVDTAVSKLNRTKFSDVVNSVKKDVSEFKKGVKGEVPYKITNDKKESYNNMKVYKNSPDYSTYKTGQAVGKALRATKSAASNAASTASKVSKKVASSAKNFATGNGGGKAGQAGRAVRSGLSKAGSVAKNFATGNGGGKAGQAGRAVKSGLNKVGSDASNFASKVASKVKEKIKNRNK